MFDISITTMDEVEEVTIKYGHVTHIIDIEDVNQDDLRELFNIDFDVKYLIEEETKKTILIKKKDKIKPGLTYIIKAPVTAEHSKRSSQVSNDGDGVNESWIYDNHEIIQNCLVVSKAVYETNASDYLLANLRNHNLKSIIRSQNTDCHFLIAEELDQDRVYIGFRGTEDTRDITEDLRIYQRAAEAGQARGKFHAGFLSRAEMFPLVKILTNERFLQKTFIICGHSLGGAISSIVTTEILIEREKRTKVNNDKFVKDVINITFGSPLFGDESVRKYLEEKKISRKMFHFVAEKDPVPSLLSFAQSVSAIKYQVDNQIRSLIGSVQIQNIGGQTYVEEKKNYLIAQKDSYVSFLSSLGPFLSPALDLASFVSPSKAGTAKLFVEGLNMILKGMDESKSDEIKRIYVPIGNFMFLYENRQSLKCFNSLQFNDVTRALDILREAEIQESLGSHKLKNYMKYCSYNDCFNEGCYNIEHVILLPFGPDGDEVSTIPRTIQDVDVFYPTIDKAELTTVTGLEIMILRLSLVGKNISEICLPWCVFQFGFPFGKHEETVVKKIPLGNGKEKIVIEQPMRASNLSISDHGAVLHLATQFGSCDALLPRQNIRNIKLQSISQISKHESISLVIKKSVQRGMALAQLKDRNAVTEPIVERILKLAEKSLSKSDYENFNSILSDTETNIQFILSNKEEYEKVSHLCDKIEHFMRSPIEIYAEKSLLQRLSIGALTVVGGGAVAYLAGPGLLLIGAIEAVNIGGAMAAGVAGAGGAGYAANRFFTEAIADRNYVQVLKWITAELYKVYSLHMKEINPKRLEEVSDLRDDDSIYSNEKALLLMFNKEKGIENFNGSGIEKSNEKSKMDLLKRIDCIEIVHKIRNILATQCFIGLVGLQDSGKTTLLNKIWGFSQRIGMFSHTDYPVLHQITNKVHIIDFPGSNSLDYHSKTFSICGAMNNMIIVLVPFSGDVSDLVSNEIAKVFEVMAGSESSRVVVCINKCEMYLDKLKKELKDEEDPIRFMKERYASKLNEHFTNSYIRIKKEHLLFTDWEVSTHGRQFGIEGVEEIKEYIKDHLIELNVINKDDVSELEATVSPPYSSVM